VKITDLIAKAEQERDAKLASRNAIAAELDSLRSQDEVDESQVSEKRAAKNALDAEIDVLIERVADLKAEQARDEAMERLQRESAPAAPKPSYDGVARVGQEKRTYSPESDRTGAQFLQDIVRGSIYGDYDAQQRLGRHMAEERVERSEYLQRGPVGQSAFAGLTVPQYLTDLVAPSAKAARPFADVMRKLELPSEGSSVVISRVTTGTAAAVQTELSAVTESSICLLYTSDAADDM
jgi:hypothetical protein